MVVELSSEAMLTSLGDVCGRGGCRWLDLARERRVLVLGHRAVHAVDAGGDVAACEPVASYCQILAARDVSSVRAHVVNDRDGAGLVASQVVIRAVSHLLLGNHGLAYLPLHRDVV